MSRMKIAVPMLLMVAATSLLAAGVEPTDKRNVLTFSTGSFANAGAAAGGFVSGGDLEYRRVFSDSRLVAIALFGYHEQSYSDGTGDHFSAHLLDAGAGLRHNFTTADQFRPFIQGTITRSSYEQTASIQCDNQPYWSGAAAGGIEYFISPRFSVEGMGGLSYSRQRGRCGATGSGSYSFHSSQFSTFRSAVAINFYF